MSMWLFWGDSVQKCLVWTCKSFTQCFPFQTHEYYFKKFHSLKLIILLYLCLFSQIFYHITCFNNNYFIYLYWTLPHSHASFRYISFCKSISFCLLLRDISITDFLSQWSVLPNVCCLITLPNHWNLTQWHLEVISAN